jgi:hypothetical protein
MLGSVVPFLFSGLTVMTLDAVSRNLVLHVSTNEAAARMNVLKVPSRRRARPGAHVVWVPWGLFSHGASN